MDDVEEALNTPSVRMSILALFEIENLSYYGYRRYPVLMMKMTKILLVYMYNLPSEKQSSRLAFHGMLWIWSHILRTTLTKR